MTIKVPWQMEKGVRIHGQNVVVIIEPDPALADGRLTEEAISALETLHVRMVSRISPLCVAKNQKKSLP